MKKLAPESEHFQHFFEEVREDFWQGLYTRTREAWKKFFDAESERERDRYCGLGWYERGNESKADYRNGSAVWR